jgi:hypothetical protein
MMANALPLSLRAGLMAALAIALLAGCGKKDQPSDKGTPAAGKAAGTEAPGKASTSPAADREIRIDEIRPEVGNLKAGQTVKIVVGGSYKLPSGGGNVGIVVQDAKNNLIMNKLLPVNNSSGSFTQEIEFKIPQTEKIQLYVPLYAKGDTKSSAVASRDWPVKDK